MSLDPKLNGRLEYRCGRCYYANHANVSGTSESQCSLPFQIGL